MKIKALVMASVMVLASLVSGCGQKKAANAPAPELEKIGPAEITTKAIKNEASFASYDYQIPVVKLTGKYSSNADSLNSSIMKKLEEEKTDAEKFTKDIAEQGDVITTKFRYGSEYKVGYNKDGLISLAVTYTRYTGGAHEDIYTVFYNYDLKNKKEILLQDLFKKDVSYKDIILTEIKKQIDADTGFEDDAMKVVNNSINHPQFYFTEEGVMMYYSPYSIASFSKGEIFFLITKDLSYATSIGKGDKNKDNSTNNSKDNSANKPASEAPAKGKSTENPDISDEDILQAIIGADRITSDIIEDGRGHVFEINRVQYGKLTKYDTIQKIQDAYSRYCLPEYSVKMIEILHIDKRNGYLSIGMGDGMSANYSNSKIVKRQLLEGNLQVTITEEFAGETKHTTYVFSRDKADGGRFKLNPLSLL